MTTINGKLNGAIAGLVRFTPDHAFVDYSTTPDTFVSLPYEAAIANSAFTIVVPQSQNLSGVPGVTTEGITYKIELFQSKTITTFYTLDGIIYTGGWHLHTDGFYWTGTIRDANSRRLDRIQTTENVLFQEEIHAVVPDIATIDFTSLVGIPANRPYLDVSLHGLAALLTTVATYRDRISAKFNIRGAYLAATTYNFLDYVTFNGNSYIYNNQTPSSGNTPPMSGDNSFWLMAAAKGAAGGTGAVIIGYNPATWAGKAVAAAQGDVRDAIASVSAPDLSSYQLKAEGAPRNNAVFTGTTKRTTLSYPVAAAEKATEVPTVECVESAIAALASGPGFLPRPLIYARRVAEQSINKDTSTPIVWDNRVIGQSMLATNGDFTIPANASYLFHSSLLYEMDGNIGANNSRSVFELLISRWNSGTSSFSDVGNLIFENEASTAGLWRSRRQGWRYLADAIAGEIYSFRAKASGVGINSNNLISPGGNAGQSNYLLAWRIN